MASDTATANNLPAFIWDEALIRRYDLSGTRYTSSPTAVEFTPNYSIEDMVKAAGRSKAAGGPISLYTHLPFCAHLCYYCACNKVITKKRDKACPLYTTDAADERTSVNHRCQPDITKKTTETLTQH